MNLRVYVKSRLPSIQIKVSELKKSSLIYTEDRLTNQRIDQLHQRILSISPLIRHQTQLGFKANNYLIGTSMKDVFCYIICYEKKANVGFPQGIILSEQFPHLKGTGKTHRHLLINEALIEDQKTLIALLHAAFSLQK